MDFIDRIEKSKSFWFLLGLLILFFLLRFPSLFEPYWYGDEGITQIVSISIQKGQLLYRDIWDNKPPLFYLMYGLFNGDLFSIRLFSLFFGMGAVLVFYNLAGLLFNDRKVQVIVTSFFSILLAIPLLEGNIANAENFIVFPTLLSFYLFYRLVTRKKFKDTKLAFVSGLLLGISFLMKVVAVFDFLTLLSFYMILNFKSFKITSIWKIVKGHHIFLFTFIFGFLAFYLVSSLYFLLQGAFTFFIDSTLSGNIAYVGWKNTFFFSQGLLLIKVLLLLTVVFFLFKTKSKFKERTILILLWLSFSIFNAYFSHRPYTHYLLVLLPSLSLFLGFIFLKQRFAKKVAVAFSVVVMIFFLDKHFDRWTIKRTVEYYKNFLDFTANKKSFVSYQNFFDSRNQKDYAIATFLKNNTKSGDKVFLWGNSAQIYVLSNTLPVGRYSVAYHILMKNAIEETDIEIKKTKPKYIIITPDESYFPFILEEYAYRLTIQDTHIYERIL